jgi:iron complex transport system substrate-binding protein
MRIVSLLPSATEILFALGLEDQIVGVTHECDYPAAAIALPHLTSSALPNAASSAEIDRHVRAGVHGGSSLYALDSALLERLAPDLIVTQELCAVCAVSYDVVLGAVRRLSTDSRVVSLEPASLEDVYGTIDALGEITRTQDAARSLIAALRHREASIAQAVSGLPRPTVLLLEWTDPPFSAGHWSPGLIELAGGVPVCANPGANSRTIEWREAQAADPDVIVVAPCGLGLDACRREVAALGRKSEWTSLRAVREGRVLTMDGSSYVNRPGPRLIDTAEIIAAALHPESGLADRRRRFA